MTEPSTHTSVIEKIQDLLLDTQDVEDFLAELARHCAEALSGPNGKVLAGITLMRQRSAFTVASSSNEAQQLDEVQYKFKDGPCLKACREKVLIHVPDLSRDQTWPEYSDVIVKRGIRSVLAVPFELTGDEARAGLNLYSDQPKAFGQDEVKEAIGLVEQASTGLSLAVRLANSTETANHLRAAMEARTVIDTAIGVIIGQNRCSQEEAIRLIKSASSSRNMKLRDVAVAIVQSAGGGELRTHFD
ncbi:GAF and ANTAR domain-containing protein [Pseudarthrobacter sp. J75]|uniref:GAF and ANTAR domain-containing protein n=1 Tax=unclassified Pseudarthrobacter TaxID=2647000 RepID=UPI002E80FD34|nr:MULTISPECIES: GAF and ANTAR domain-containing protein [unclassified Pseudarthrobacter]MEE2522311.1 GAF and ANTAR domain-containing protein [Pseudarthrobacter sp. J47]MEE2528043.1 GAF and ANTAR domain-containing protein [Pseudarthrobacter sp. J75]MEE2568711.1 GAF and ANTAR domain-containing protein [Pseudarthrobacter sp. J64]